VRPRVAGTLMLTNIETLGAGRPSRDAARMTISRLYPGSNEPYLQREIILE
jgi:hypothetical protein